VKFGVAYGFWVLGRVRCGVLRVSLSDGVDAARLNVNLERIRMNYIVFFSV